MKTMMEQWAYIHEPIQKPLWKVDTLSFEYAAEPFSLRLIHICMKHKQKKAQCCIFKLHADLSIQSDIAMNRCKLKSKFCNLFQFSWICWTLQYSTYFSSYSNQFCLLSICNVNWMYTYSIDLQQTVQIRKLFLGWHRKAIYWLMPCYVDDDPWIDILNWFWSSFYEIRFWCCFHSVYANVGIFCWASESKHVL